MKVKGLFWVVLAILLNISLVSAMQVTYTVEAHAVDVNNVSGVTETSSTQDCTANCSYPMPSFTIPENYTVTGYALKFTASDNYKIFFNSTGNANTNDANDLVIVEVVQQQQPPKNDTPPKEPELTCNENTCDKGCVVCEDDNCHPKGFVCKAELTLDKISPTSIGVGNTQINILLKNTGTVDIENVKAELAGDGITTIESIPIDNLVAGDKDYAFVRINASKPGTIDLVVKIFINGKQKSSLVSQINVAKPEAPVENITKNETPEFNVTELTAKINSLKERYRLAEEDYQNKKLAGYIVDVVPDKLKEAHSYVTDAQFYLFEGTYKKVASNIEVAEDSLDNIENILKNAQQKKETWGDKIKSNLVYIGSLAAAFISIITAYSLIKRSVKHGEIAERIPKRLKEKFGKKSEESAEAKKEAKPEEKKKDHKVDELE